MPRRAAAGRAPDADAVVEYHGTGGPEGTLRISEPEVVKALLDPRRQRLLRHLVAPRSVKEVAERVGEPPSKLYYHVRLLEQHGIVRSVAQRRVGSNVEHVYQLAARRFEVAAGLGDVVRPAGSAITGRLVETAQRYGAAMAERPKGRRDPAIRAAHEASRFLTHEEAALVWERLEQVMAELPGDDGDGAARVRYGIHVMLAPLPEQAG